MCLALLSAAATSLVHAGEVSRRQHWEMRNPRTSPHISYMAVPCCICSSSWRIQNRPVCSEQRAPVQRSGAHGSLCGGGGCHCSEGGVNCHVSDHAYLRHHFNGLPSRKGFGAVRTGKAGVIFMALLMALQMARPLELAGTSAALMVAPPFHDVVHNSAASVGDDSVSWMTRLRIPGVRRFLSVGR